MLFNSYIFICAFLPVVLAGFFALGQVSRQAAILWLIAASLVFYAWWRPLNVALIAPSILLNFAAARTLLQIRQARPGAARLLLLAGIAFNVCFLGYFKYYNFFLGAAGDLSGRHPVLVHLVLPLGISFITFQKIAFLIDVYSGRVAQVSLRDYALFVLFFPQLVAGPIVHYREMMPQFQAASCRFDADNLAVGASLFCFGLFKKGVLADRMALYVSPLYAAAAGGGHPGLVQGWIAALGYTLQIYFDFSGYTDMALGLARCFGIKLPPNFNSPLKATSIIDFWQRWHMSLTRFLTAYIYNPLTLALARRRLAGGRSVLGRRPDLPAFAVLLAGPTLLTMLVSGIWHGAGYTFILWGLLHGVFLVVNHAWRMVRPRVFPNAASYARAAPPFGFLLTFTSVAAAMVMFRAPDAATAWRIWGDMIGLHGVILPQAIADAFSRHFAGAAAALGVQAGPGSGKLLVQSLGWLAILLAVAWLFPNTLQMLAAREPALGIKPKAAPKLRAAAWQPTPGWALGMAAIGAFGFLSLGSLSEFLYWQF